MNKILQERKNRTGIIFTDFQCSTLTTKHREMLFDAATNHLVVIVVLPNKTIGTTRKHPLSIKERIEMIREVTKNFTGAVFDVVEYNQRKHVEYWQEDFIALVEQTVSREISGRQLTDFDLYTDTGCPLTYRDIFTDEKSIHVYDVDAFENNFSINLLDKYTTTSEAFRAGKMIARSEMYPISWPTVDIAITRPDFLTNKKELLLGRKKDEVLWRFPGGFKDREDNSYEDAVLREAAEEVLIEGAPSKDLFTSPKYISSMNVDDWRYKGEKDGITTSFFHTVFFGNDEWLQASDDLEEIKWFDVKQIIKTDLVTEHQRLFEDFLAYNE